MPTFDLIPRQLPVDLGHDTSHVVSCGRLEVVTAQRFRFSADVGRQP